VTTTNLRACEVRCARAVRGRVGNQSWFLSLCVREGQAEICDYICTNHVSSFSPCGQSAHRQGSYLKLIDFVSLNSRLESNQEEEEEESTGLETARGRAATISPFLYVGSRLWGLGCRVSELQMFFLINRT